MAAGINAAVAILAGTLEHAWNLGTRPALFAFVRTLDVLLVAGVVAEIVLRGVAAERPLALLRTRWADFLALLLAGSLLAGGHPRVAGAVVMLRMTVLGILRLRAVPVAARLSAALRTRPLASLALSFAVTILLGGAVLTFPAATADGGGAPVLVALFTATSATCVTGLVVVDTATYWSHFGHWVILVLMQLGGLGIMTLTTALSMVFGGLSLRDRAAMQEILEQETAAGFRALLARVVLLTLALEAVGAGLLWLRLSADPAAAGVAAGDGYGLVFVAVFHAVSAFCNAGFALWSDGLARFAGDLPVNGTIAVLIVAGGLGFPVLGRFFTLEAIRAPRRFLSGLPVHDRLALAGTGWLLAAGFVGTLVLEWSAALGPLPAGERFLAAAFASVTSRTAGFNTIDYGALTAAGLLLTAALMFVGGSPGGTAGGIKTTTLAVLVLAVRTLLRGRTEVEVRGRRLPETTVYRAVAVTLISIAFLFGTFLLLLLVEPLPFDRLLFEAVSAFGTVGLSMNLTPSLSDPGRVIVMLLMFAGRLGPFTLALAIGASRRPSGYSFPTGRVLVG